jgi:predicted DNA-binding transcriptional regulator AlpA
MDAHLYLDSKPAFLTYGAAAARVGLSPATIRRLVATGRFPPPVSLLPRRPAFAVSEVEKWIAARIAERGGAAA